MFNIIIRGGRVVTIDGVGELDVAIQGDKIATLSTPGIISDDEVHRVIDARGKIVVPGGIDPHVHCDWPLMHVLDGRPAFSAPASVVSRAAIFGGTTTLLDFAIWKAGDKIRDTLERRNQAWRGQSYADYSFHVMLQGEIPPETLDEIPEAIQAGYPSFKLFTTDVTPSRHGRKVGHGDIWEILARLSQHGGIAALHAEDDDIVMHNYAKLAREGRTAFTHVHEVHTALAEELAIRRVIQLANHAGDTPLYFMHVSTAEGVQAIADAKARGKLVFGETLHLYALYTSEAYARPNGQIYHNYPSLKSSRDCAALWDGMRTGVIDVLATDEVCTPLKTKLLGERIDDLTGGNAGIEPRMAIMYTEAVAKRGFSLERFIDLTSTNAARILGMFPQKGAIAPGSDADITVLDPQIRRTLRAEDLHETDYSPWEGTEVLAWPVLTMLRGEVVMEDGRLCGDPYGGQLVMRKLSETAMRRVG